MPLVSKAQWKLLASKIGKPKSEGGISKDKFDEMVQGVDFDKLPEHVEDKNSARRGKLKSLEKHLAKLRGRLKRT